VANWPNWLPIKESLRDNKVYGAPQIQDVIKLNTNENPYQLPKSVITELTNEIEIIAKNLNRYPDRDAIKLRSALAEYLSKDFLTAENIWAANGSNEILQQIFLAYANSSCVGLSPSYSVHPLIAKITNSDWTAIPLKEDFTIDIPALHKKIEETNPSLIFITSPNNPTGGVVKLSDIKKIAEFIQGRSALLIVDEAYAEFSSEKSAIELIKDFPQIAVVRTMSKAFAFAGVRVGYLVADPNVIAGLMIVRLPYHLSTLTQAAALVALNNVKLMQSEIELIVSERNRLHTEMTKLGLKVIDSGANFLFFTGFQPKSQDLWQRILDHGILIRDVGIEGFLRVTIGTPEENEQFLNSLKTSLR
jgi:histidinol-phosphate aminotransferase